jgi:hypothetical protein
MQSMRIQAEAAESDFVRSCTSPLFFRPLSSPLSLLNVRFSSGGCRTLPSLRLYAFFPFLFLVRPNPDLLLPSHRPAQTGSAKAALSVRSFPLLTSQAPPPPLSPLRSSATGRQDQEQGCVVSPFLSPTPIASFHFLPYFPKLMPFPSQFGRM